MSASRAQRIAFSRERRADAAGKHKKAQIPRPQRPRLARIAQHVVQRGIDRQAVIFEDRDRKHYLACLSEKARWYGLAVHVYCLMVSTHACYLTLGESILFHRPRRLVPVTHSNLSASTHFLHPQLLDGQN